MRVSKYTWTVVKFASDASNAITIGCQIELAQLNIRKSAGNVHVFVNAYVPWADGAL
jgi:hypothetical protein